MHTILLQLERLRRAYDLAVRTYDEISLLDLSHALRIWADLAPALPEKAPRFAQAISFKSETVPKRLYKALRGAPHILAFMPGGVNTYASNGDVAHKKGEVPMIVFLACLMMVKHAEHFLRVSYFVYGECDLSDDLKGAKYQGDLKRLNFSQWLGADAVRVKYVNAAGAMDSQTISREHLIRRVANTMDGSHPSAASASSGEFNRYDEPIRHMMQFGAGALPLPYFLLLKMAQDILAVAPALRKKDG